MRLLEEGGNQGNTIAWSNNNNAELLILIYSMIDISYSYS